MSQTTIKKIGIGLLFIPLLFFLLFFFGEILSGDLSGLSHLIQAAPIVLLIYLTFKKPFITGLILVLLSLVLGIGYALDVPFNLQTILLVELFLFIPPFISGVLLIYSTKKN